MSPTPVYLTIGEFNRSIEMLRQTITGRCDRMDTQLDEQTVKITTIETILDGMTSDDKSSARKSASGWSAGVAGAIIGAFELIRLLAK
jgi:hypothetical protein